MPKKKVDRKQLADKIKKWFMAGVAYKRSQQFYDRWREYERFWQGDQWPEPTSDTEILPRPVTNHFAAVIERKISALLADLPEIYFEPADADPKSSASDEAAQTLTAMAAYQSQHLGSNDEDVTLEELLEDGTRSAALFGTGIWYFGWDNTIVRGTPGVAAYIGDIVGKEIDPTMFFVGNPHDPCIQTQPRIIVAERRNLEDVKHFYREFAPDEVGLLQPERADDETYVYEHERISQEDADQVTVLHCWWKEIEEETGEKILNYAVECQGRLLRYEERFYEHGLYPFVSFQWYPRRKSFWGKPEGADLIGNQKEINRLDAIMLLSAYTVGMPHIRYKEPFVDPRDITNDPGSLVKDTAPLGVWAVDYMNPPPLPAYLAAVRDRLVAEVKDVTGVHDAWAGKAPSAQLNASAIIALQEAAGISIRGIQKRLHRAVREMGRLWLAFWTEFCTESRLIRFVKPGNEIAVVWFRGTDYRDMRFDIHVKAGTASPYSRALYMANLDKLLSIGIITPDEYLEMLPAEVFPHAEQVLQRRRQQQEAQMMLAAQQAQAQGVQGLMRGSMPSYHFMTPAGQPVSPELLSEPVQQAVEAAGAGGGAQQLSR